MGLQVWCPQLWHSWTQPLGILFCYNGRDAKSPASLGKKGKWNNRFFDSEDVTSCKRKLATSALSDNEGLTCSTLAALLTMLVNWKIVGRNFSCMSQSNSTVPLVESLPMLPTAIYMGWHVWIQHHLQFNQNPCTLGISCTAWTIHYLVS